MRDCVCLSLCYEFTCSSLHPLRAFTLLVSRHSEKWEKGTHCLDLYEDPLGNLHTTPLWGEIKEGGAKSGHWYSRGGLNPPPLLH